MNIQISKKEASHLIGLALYKIKHSSYDFAQNFEIEISYAEYFLLSLSEIKVELHTDIVPMVTEKFKEMLDTASKNIYEILDKHSVDGSAIREILANKKFIHRKVRLAYNHQIQGKYPKGIKKKEWATYNHWLLTYSYWLGFLWSQDSNFQIVIPDDIHAPNEVLQAKDLKPLWGMLLKAREAGLESLTKRD